MDIKPEFSWVFGNWAISQPEFLKECADLYSNHYGFWSDKSPWHPGERIKLSPSRISEWLDFPGAKMFYARLNGLLIGYCIATIEKVPKYGQIAWVSQLVVHEKYRHKGVGKNLLFSIWTFSNYFAWGVLTSSPYAIRALEKATRRRCVPIRIKRNKGMLFSFAVRNISYVTEDMEVEIDDKSSRMNTNFFADHSQLLKMIENVTTEETPWTLGHLDEGWEWFAFTFNDQVQLKLTSQEIEEMLRGSDDVTKQAYSRMSLTLDHLWSRHTDDEVQFIIGSCNIKTGTSILDFGCGRGRHAIALSIEGMDVVGVDYSATLITVARHDAQEKKVDTVEFVVGDCRTVKLNRIFDVTLCLYDVIGSFINDEDNLNIIKNLYNHTKKAGHVIITVMNYELTKSKAKHFFSLKKDASKLLELPASQIMEKTGDIFDANYYLIDEDERVIYRKEQFSEGSGMPEEFIIRDKRYTKTEIVNVCQSVGFSVLEARYVGAGKWDISLDACDEKAKEILVICKKE